MSYLPGCLYATIPASQISGSGGQVSLLHIIVPLSHWQISHSFLRHTLPLGMSMFSISRRHSLHTGQQEP